MSPIIQSTDICRSARVILKDTLLMHCFQIAGHIVSRMTISRISVGMTHTIKARAQLRTVINHNKRTTILGAFTALYRCRIQYLLLSRVQYFAEAYVSCHPLQWVLCWPAHFMCPCPKPSACHAPLFSHRLCIVHYCLQDDHAYLFHGISINSDDACRGTYI
jgi:hypothetical protein